MLLFIQLSFLEDPILQTSPVPDPTQFLGVSRFNTYLNAAHNDVSFAYELYAWNTRLAGAFHEVLGHAEIAVRNAIDLQLRSWNPKQSDNTRNGGKTFNEEWCIDPALPLHGLMKDELKRAQRYANKAKNSRLPSHARKQAEITHDDLVSQLTFGTWNSLVPDPDEKDTARIHLWEEAIKGAFPEIKSGSEGIRQVKYPFKTLHKLRNRVAHGEPLLHLEANKRLNDIARLTSYIDPQITDWIMSQQRVRETVSERPNMRQ